MFAIVESVFMSIVMTIGQVNRKSNYKNLQVGGKGKRAVNFFFFSFSKLLGQVSFKQNCQKMISRKIYEVVFSNSICYIVIMAYKNSMQIHLHYILILQIV